jgi:hypothetical protein
VVLDVNHHLLVELKLERLLRRRLGLFVKR